jgi:hypothetical protein
MNFKRIIDYLMRLNHPCMPSVRLWGDSFPTAICIEDRITSHKLHLAKPGRTAAELEGPAAA